MYRQQSAAIQTATPKGKTDGHYEAEKDGEAGHQSQKPQLNAMLRLEEPSTPGKTTNSDLDKVINKNNAQNIINQISDYHQNQTATNGSRPITASKNQN